MRPGALALALRLCVVGALFLGASAAQASPTVPLDDPRYERLAVLQALGRLPLYERAIRPLTEYELERLLMQAEGEDYRGPHESRYFWVAPLRRAAFRLGGFFDQERPYSTAERPADMAGGIAVSCEHQEGRPCGRGGGGLFELDGATGVGKYLSIATRLQVRFGANQWAPGGDVDRLYVNGEVSGFGWLVGRDVLALGPGARTQLLVGDHTAPLDHLRFQTARPLKIPRLPVTFSGLYALGRLRDPQTFHNTLFTATRLALAFADQLELGAQQLLQLDGEGAIHYSLGDFFVEHFTRTGPPGTVGGSNRRASLDASYTNQWARGLRLYYELAFEDFRKRVWDMLRYDCDHLVSAELPALLRDGRHGLLFELQHSGPLSQVHSYFLTGMTNAGRALGTPLGPDSWSAFLQARLDLGRLTVWPWIEWARLSSDRYAIIDFGPIYVTEHRQPETRYRIGARARWSFGPGLRLEGRALLERVVDYAFVRGAKRGNGGAEVMLVWEPGR